MATIYELVQNNRDAFLEMPVEELAGLVLQDLAARKGSAAQLQRGTYCANFAQHGGEEGAKAIAESWQWLEFHGCLALDPTYYGSNVSFVTRRGRELAKNADQRPLIVEELRLRELLHPKIIEKSWSTFIRRGEEDLAVLAAFIAVEVAVREAANQSNDVHGIDLMSIAFKQDGGILTDKTAPKSERESVYFLFRGAHGYCRNPPGHREIGYTKDEASRLLMLASYLLQLVDARREGLTKHPERESGE